MKVNFLYVKGRAQMPIPHKTGTIYFAEAEQEILLDFGSGLKSYGRQGSGSGSGSGSGDIEVIVDGGEI